MKQIGVLHVSDFHFGSPKKGEIGDKKSGNIKEGFAEKVIHSNSLECFHRQLGQLVPKNEVDVIICTGDVGNYGDAESICDGLDYLAKLARVLDVDSSNVIVTPGNHDLDRNAIVQNAFDTFINKCESLGFTYAKVDKITSIECKGVPVVAINSCMGGTEHAMEGVPENIKDLAKKAINDTYNEDPPLDNVPDEYKYQLKAMDIPAVGKSQESELE